MTIKVKILAHSITPYSPVPQLLTFDCLYPRVIHAEVMTHKMLSKERNIFLSFTKRRKNKFNNA